MMKKLLILFGLLLMIPLVLAAPLMPHPIYGYITSEGLPVSNMELKVENLATKVFATTSTDNNGFYQVELANFDSNYRTGDSVKISLVFCSNVNICSKTITIFDNGGDKVSWDLIGITTPLPETVTIIKYICWDGTGVDDVSKCPPIPPKYICSDNSIVDDIAKCPTKCADGTFVPIETDCPEKSDTWIRWVIGIIIAIFAGAGGWKIYNGKLKHYHKGITGYHDPNTVHTNEAIRHTSWKVSPLKCISDVKKIQS